MKDYKIEFDITVKDGVTESQIEEDLKALLELLQYKSKNLTIIDSVQKNFQDLLKKLEEQKKLHDPWEEKQPPFPYPWKPSDGAPYWCKDTQGNIDCVVVQKALNQIN